jgi:DNA replicative helicase MCM subunit Mcm2 (Cdc46/Mcm family)
METITFRKDNDKIIITLPKNITFNSDMVKELDIIFKPNIMSGEIKINTNERTELKNKLPKTTYSVRYDDKLFNSSKMSDNYLKAIKSLIQDNKSIIPVIKNILKNYIKTDINHFKNNSTRKNSVHKISDGLYISTYSSSQIKKEHLNKISEATNIPIYLEELIQTP